MGLISAVLHMIHDVVHVVEVKRFKPGVLAPVCDKHVITGIAHGRYILFGEGAQFFIKRLHPESIFTGRSVETRLDVFFKEKIAFLRVFPAYRLK